MFAVQPCHPTPKTMPTIIQDFKIRKNNLNEGTGWQHPQQQGTLTLQTSGICSPKIVNANVLLGIQAASLQAWHHTDRSTRCTAKQLCVFSPCKGSVMLTRGQACPRLHNRHPSGLWSWSLHWLELRAPHFGLYLGGVSESATATCAVVIRTRKQILACYLGCGSDAEGFCRRTGGSSHSSSASLPRKVPRRHRRQKPWRGNWRMLWIHRHAFITAIHENRSLSASRFAVGKES